MTDAGGDILIDGLPYGTYSLVETKQPSGYQKPSETEAAHPFIIDDKLFTKNSDGTYTAKTVEISAVNKPIKVIVKKVFAETVQGQEYFGSVKDAKLEIWDKTKKNKIEEWITDGEEEGHEVKCLVPGEYVLVESSAPNGFLTAKEIPFTIDGDGTLRMKGEAVVDGTVTMSDKAVYGKIILNKEGEVLKDLGVKEVAGGLLHTFEWILGKLENVTFAIFAEEDICIQDTVVFKKDQKIGTIYTGVDGIAAMEGLLPGKYYAREISNADGNYKVDSMARISLVLSYKDSDTPIVVAENTVLNKRYKAEVQLLKTDADDGSKPVAGAVYGLYVAQDNRILKKDELLAKAVTDETGKAAFAVDLPVGNYYVKELESPEGYLLNEAVSTIEFTKESRFSLQVTDTARKLCIGKVDPDGKPVSGALLDADGKEIDSWMSGEDYHELCAVAPGSYTLREKKAPEGYETAGDMKIVVKEKDSVVTVNMVDVPAESEEPTQEEPETEETTTEETTPEETTPEETTEETEETAEETTQPSPTESVPEEPRRPSGEEQPGEDQDSDTPGEEPAVAVSRTAQPETVEESAETESAEPSGTESPSAGTGDKAPVEAAAAAWLLSLIAILVLMRKRRESGRGMEK